MPRKCSPAAPSVSGQMRTPSVCFAFISAFVALHVKFKKKKKTLYRLVLSASTIRQTAAEERWADAPESWVFPKAGRLSDSLALLWTKHFSPALGLFKIQVMYRSRTSRLNELDSVSKNKVMQSQKGPELIKNTVSGAWKNACPILWRCRGWILMMTELCMVRRQQAVLFEWEGWCSLSPVSQNNTSQS